MKDPIHFLAEQPFLHGLDDDKLNLLARESMPTEFREGEVIMSEGGPANRFYLILEGSVNLDSPVAADESIRIQTIGPGDVLGWSWLLPPYQWQFDARAATPVKAIFFYGTRLRELCEENHDLGYELMKRVSAIVVKRMQAARLDLVECKKDALLSR